MSKQIICIKASSHSDFELYLMSEKYDIPYEFLIEYKKDKSIYKFWTELGTGIVSAIEEIIGNERIFSPTTAMSERDKQLLIAIQPLKAGQAIRKYKGDIDEKEKEFKIMSEEIEKKKQQLLNRNYDPSNIVCINSKSTPEQIFAVCLNNDIDFSYVMYFIKNNSTIDINRVWFEKKTNELVAYNYLYSNYFGEPCERFEVNMSCLIPKKAINRMSMVAVKTPKIKVTKKSLEAYQKANDSGYYINIPKFERMLESGFLERLEEEHVEKESSQIDLDLFDIEELKSLMQTAVEDEDYESAASLRDTIKEIENKKKK